MNILRISRQILSPFIDFILPPVCILCNARTDGAELCGGCLEKLNRTARVIEEGLQSDFSHLSGPLHFERVFTCWSYSPEMEKIIHWIKYRSGTRFGVFMGKMAGRMLCGRFPDGTEYGLIPVPLHRNRLRERGYNQSEILARGMARSISMEMMKGALRRMRNTPSQTFLNAQERRKNVENAFQVRNPEAVRSKVCVLVDDVCTTGATMNACAAALKDAGASRVLGVALVRPQFRERSNP